MLKQVTMKFGGTSVGDAEAIRRTVGIIRYALDGQTEQAVVVVSAMSGVTDALQEGLLAAVNGDLGRAEEATEQIRQRQAEAAAALFPQAAEPLLQESHQILDRYLELCRSANVLEEATPRTFDQAMSVGERLSARLVAAGMQAEGLPSQAVDATTLIVTDERFQDAAPLEGPTRSQLQAQLPTLLAEGVTPIVTGFLGATANGVTTTLGRGGSDFSASLIGAYMDSDEVWIWTDVDGVMSADPRIVPAARSIETLSYREVAELAYFGAKVLHPKSIQPVVDSAIPLRVKNTFAPEHPGTLIAPGANGSGATVKAVTAIPKVSLVTVEGKGMIGIPGIAARTFGAVAERATSVLLISQASSEQTICFAVPQGSASEVIESIQSEFALELARQDIDKVWSLDGVTIVTAVGAGMRGTPGVAGKIFTATGEHNINVYAIAQGSSECSLSLVVDSADSDRAVTAIHDLTMEATASPS